MHNIVLTKQQLIDLKCLIRETDEFKSTEYKNNRYSEEEQRLIDKFLKPVFEKIGMYK
jgi:hypothetical protein|tara:strand:- start:2133 stop:2306 length:174 start_codon:yes stop_codon:yes gene_type:complete